MEYLLLIYFDEQSWTEAERQACYLESTQLAQELNSSRKYLSANPLQPVATATSVRVRDDKCLVTDGPFAEKRELLGGFSSSTLVILTRRLGLLRKFQAQKRVLSRFVQYSKSKAYR